MRFSNSLALLAFTLLSTTLASPVPGAGEALLNRGALDAIERRAVYPPTRRQIAPPVGITPPPWRTIPEPVKRAADVEAAEGPVAPPWRREADSKGPVAPAWRREADTEGPPAPPWRREANSEGPVAPAWRREVDSDSVAAEGITAPDWRR